MTLARSVDIIDITEDLNRTKIAMEGGLPSGSFDCGVFLLCPQHVWVSGLKRLESAQQALQLSDLYIRTTGFPGSSAPTWHLRVSIASQVTQSKLYNEPFKKINYLYVLEACAHV